MKHVTMILVILTAVLAGAVEAHAELSWLQPSEKAFVPRRDFADDRPGSKVSEAWSEWIDGARLDFGLIVVDYDSEMDWENGLGFRALWEHPLLVDTGWADVYLNFDLEFIDSEIDVIDEDTRETRIAGGITFDVWSSGPEDIFTGSLRALAGGNFVNVDSEKESGAYLAIEIPIRFRIMERVNFNVTPGIEVVGVDGLSLDDPDEDSFVNRHMVFSLSWTF